MAKRLLILEDGTIFEGTAFGADLDVTGEIVFNTGMTLHKSAPSISFFTRTVLHIGVFELIEPK